MQLKKIAWIILIVLLTNVVSAQDLVPRFEKGDTVYLEQNTELASSSLAWEVFGAGIAEVTGRLEAGIEIKVGDKLFILEEGIGQFADNTQTSEALVRRIYEAGSAVGFKAGTYLDTENKPWTVSEGYGLAISGEYNTANEIEVQVEEAKILVPLANIISQYLPNEGQKTSWADPVYQPNEEITLKAGAVIYNEAGQAFSVGESAEVTFVRRIEDFGSDALSWGENDVAVEAIYVILIGTDHYRTEFQHLERPVPVTEDLVGSPTAEATAEATTEPQ